MPKFREQGKVPSKWVKQDDKRIHRTEQGKYPRIVVRRKNADGLPSPRVSPSSRPATLALKLVLTKKCKLVSCFLSHSAGQSRTDADRDSKILVQILLNDTMTREIMKTKLAKLYRFTHSTCSKKI